jgi:hypothetical protein
VKEGGTEKFFSPSFKGRWDTGRFCCSPSLRGRELKSVFLVSLLREEGKQEKKFSVPPSFTGKGVRGLGS